MVEFAIIHSTRGNLWVSESGHQFIKIDPERIAFSSDGELLEQKESGASIIHQFEGEAAVLIGRDLISGPKEWVDSIAAELLAIRPGRARVWTKKRARCAVVDADEAVRMIRE